MHSGGRSKYYGVEADGYVTHYFEGATGSVSFTPESLNKKHIIHNHPRGGWANFSGRDLLTFADSGVTGMSAVSIRVLPAQNASKKTIAAYKRRRAGEYRITKTNHFNREGFTKELRALKVRDNNYDKDLHKWLSDNQKKYGYRYSYKKNKDIGDLND